jgi:hypothetical protein
MSYASVFQVMQSLGCDLVKVERCEWPERAASSSASRWTRRSARPVSAERAEKLRGCVSLTLKDLPGVICVMTRKSLASVIGKLQFNSPRGGLQVPPTVMILMAGECAQNICADLRKCGELTDRRLHHVRSEQGPVK